MRLQLCEHELDIVNLPTFSIRDETISRSDLAARRETKFALMHADVKKFRRHFEATGRRLVHNEEVSVVRSVYFDDFRLTAGHANIDGLGMRRKLRLRWYDMLAPSTDAFLEVKWRNNRVTGKHRMSLQSDQPLCELSYSQIYKALIKSVSANFLPDLLAFPDPVLLVEYRREHFASLDKSLRVTLDYDLKFYDQTGKRSISTAFAHQLRDFIVIEGKTKVGDERALRSMLAPLPIHAARCSKYVHGLRSIGLIPEGL